MCLFSLLQKHRASTDDAYRRGCRDGAGGSDYIARLQKENAALTNHIVDANEKVAALTAEVAERYTQEDMDMTVVNWRAEVAQAEERGWNMAHKICQTCIDAAGNYEPCVVGTTYAEAKAAQSGKE